MIFLFSSEPLGKEPAVEHKEDKILDVKRDSSKEIPVDRPPPPAHIPTTAINTTPTPITVKVDDEAKSDEKIAVDPVEKALKSIDTPAITDIPISELGNLGKDEEAATTPPTTKEQSEENSVPKEELKVGGEQQANNKMMSFAEWKQKQDREKEIKEKSEFEEIEIVVEGSTTNKTVVVPKQKRKKKLANKKNYASPNCGAKVVAANSEAQNKNSILTEDKDAYMLIPCNIKAFVVVELCERIQLDSIDFANFEMFSSTPKRFTIHVSSRFPTRDWVHVDEFDATTGREVQTFNVKDKFYAKFIKVFTV